MSHGGFLLFFRRRKGGRRGDPSRSICNRRLIFSAEHVNECDLLSRKRHESLTQLSLLLIELRPLLVGDSLNSIKNGPTHNMLGMQISELQLNSFTLLLPAAEN